MLSHNLERLFCAQWHNIRIASVSNTKQVKKYATQARQKTSKTAENAEADFKKARPFSEIPAVKKYTLLRNMMPGGIYHNIPTTDMILDLSHKYGSIFIMPGFFGSPDLLMTLNPDDFAIVFRNEGQWPYRRPFDTMVYHREVHRREYFHGFEGLTATNGEKWSKMRTAVNPILLQPKNAKLYLNNLIEVNDELIKRIREIRDPATNEVPGTFEDEICRLTLESVTSVALNTQFGLLRKHRDTPEANKIISSVRRFFDLSFYLEILPPFWKLIKTPKFQEMMRVQDTLTDMIDKCINDALVKIEHNQHGEQTSEVDKEKSVLEKLLRVDKRFAAVVALDLIAAGVDTSSSALSGILLCIAANPEKQQKLFEEMKQVLPHKDSHFNMENMKNLPYLRGCIKEGIRMYPIIPGTLRRPPCDVVLSGYHIPAGVEVILASNLLLRNEKFVPRPNEFLPERWLRHDAVDGTQNADEIKNPFVYLPFGLGPRSCAGRRIVDMELEITVGRLVRNFNIQFNHPMDQAFKKSKFINIPGIPLKFTFEERKE